MIARLHANVFDIRPIEIHNADGLCAEQVCASIPDDYLPVTVGNLTFYLPICAMHADALETELRGEATA